ncbi:MAG: signal recognition particle protein [Thermodesulfobacteriota bacterium]
MFESLSDKLQSVFKKIRGHGTLSEANVQEALREVRLALLEADVHYKVVKDFVSSVQSKALGQEVLQSLTPGQQLVKIVHQELIRLMGEGERRLNLSGSPASIMLVGLQGSGKTTTAGKLACWLAAEGRKVGLVPADVYRPAATEQVLQLGQMMGLSVFEPGSGEDPVRICVRAQGWARERGLDTLILDTAGRLHIDEPLMEELKRIKGAVAPKEILLVADAMTGQDAVQIAQSFNQRLDITGVILTKMDGDARGGAALSIRAVTLRPIMFIGVGEKLDALEVFHPDRMASRILGMGDVLTLIEKAQAAYDEKKARELERKIRKEEFTLEDLLEQIRQVRKMGPLDDLVKMIPGAAKIKGVVDPRAGEGELKRMEAIICSMTKEERLNHNIINGSRRLRIAKGSGTTVQDVNRLLKNYLEMRKMMKKMGRMGRFAMTRGLPMVGR